MKKFISFVMAGAMVASLVPATAFAKGDVTATAKVVDATEEAKGFDGKITGSDVPELQLKVTGTDYLQTDASADPEMEVTVTLDNADFAAAFDAATNIGVRLDDPSADVDPEDLAAAKLAYDEAKKATGNKETAYNDAKGAANVEAVPAVAAAQEALTTAGNELTIAQGILGAAETALINAQDDLESAQGALETAQDAYVAEVSKEVVDADPTEGQTTAALIAEKLADVEEAQTEVDAKQAVVNAKTTAKENAQAVVNAKTTAKENAQTAYDKAESDAILEHDDVVEAKEAFDAAKATEAAAKADYEALKNGTNSITFTDIDVDEDELEFTIVGKLHKDDIIFIDLISDMDSTSEGKKATVSVDSKMVTADDMVYATVLGKGLKASVKKTVDVAEEEVVTLNSHGLKIEAAVGNLPSEITLKISKGFEFTEACDDLSLAGVYSVEKDDNELKVTVAGDTDEITIDGIEIEATSAKSGAVATITAKASNNDSASVEVAKVVDYKVNLSVDEDEDVPVIYSGVNAENDGITDDSDHLSLLVTAEESFAGAWSMRKGFNFNLPEGVYVTGMEFGDVEGFYQGTGNEIDEPEWRAAAEKAYQDGDHQNFEFDKRVFDDVDYTLNDRNKAKVEFQLKLVADPTFEGDVVLQFEGDLVDAQEVTIAKFVKPYTVKAEQNDLIIDYRNTEIPTAIVVTEPEEGLWDKNAEFTFSFDKEDVMEFEDDATFEIDADSELDIKDTTDKDKGTLKFKVKEVSEAPATVTIKDMKLFMSRNIPAGAYDLEMTTNFTDDYKKQGLFAPDEDKDFEHHDDDKESFVDDVCDYSKVVKEAFVNVVTSGRDNDNLFTTKVVVPVGEAYLVAGDAKVELDVPAYISAEGYTMLPVRAVSKALGVNTNNVLWNAESRTVTIMYGQRIISMTIGQKTLYVNGSAIPSSAAPEIKDGRTFLPLRDLGTALGVTDISWDGSTKTATMNGGK